MIIPHWLEDEWPVLPRVDLVVSFVIFDQPVCEWRHAVELVLRSALDIHVILLSNGRELAWEDDDRRVTMIRSPTNLGYGRAHNIAMMLARGRARYHLLANTDIHFDGDPLLRLSTVMDAEPAIGIAAPRILYPDGRLQANARLLPSPLDLFAKRIPMEWPWAAARRDRFLMRKMSGSTVTDVPFLTGPFLLCRSELLERLGGFDPRFFVYGEDVDLSRRAHAIARTVLVPDVKIVHSFRSEAQPSLRRLVLLADGYRRYFNKWGWFFDGDRSRINRAAAHAAASGEGR